MFHGDHSSEDYEPDLGDLSDSDREFFIQENPNENTVIPASDSDASSDSDDFVGPSDDEREMASRGRPSLLQVVRDQSNETVAPQAKKKKIFSPKLKNSRKRTRHPKEWKRNKSALAREKGQTYTSYKGENIPAKEVVVGTLCSEKCRNECNKNFSIEDRASILSTFYKLDINAKNAMLFGSIRICKINRPKKGALNHKSASFKYVISFQKKTDICLQKSLRCFAPNRYEKN